MPGMRIAGGVLAIATLAGATACAGADQPAHAMTPTATATSEPASETLNPPHL